MLSTYLTNPTDAPKSKKRTGLFIRFKEAVVVELQKLGASERLAEVAVIDNRASLNTSWFDKLGPSEAAIVLWKTILDRGLYKSDGKFHY